MTTEKDDMQSYKTDEHKANLYKKYKIKYIHSELNCHALVFVWLYSVLQDSRQHGRDATEEEQKRTRMQHSSSSKNLRG